MRATRAASISNVLSIYQWVKAKLAFAEQTRAEIGDYDRIGSEARFFDKGPKRPDMNTLATDPSYRKVLLDHRELLTRFGKITTTRWWLNFSPTTSNQSLSRQKIHLTEKRAGKKVTSSDVP